MYNRAWDRALGRPRCKNQATGYHHLVVSSGSVSGKEYERSRRGKKKEITNIY